MVQNVWRSSSNIVGRSVVSLEASGQYCGLSHCNNFLTFVEIGGQDFNVNVHVTVIVSLLRPSLHMQPVGQVYTGPMIKLLILLSHCRSAA